MLESQFNMTIIVKVLFEVREYRRTIGITPKDGHHNSQLSIF